MKPVSAINPADEDAVDCIQQRAGRPAWVPHVTHKDKETQGHVKFNRGEVCIRMHVRNVLWFSSASNKPGQAMKRHADNLADATCL